MDKKEKRIVRGLCTLLMWVSVTVYLVDVIILHPMEHYPSDGTEWGEFVSGFMTMLSYSIIPVVIFVVYLFIITGLGAVQYREDWMDRMNRGKL